MKVIRAIVKNVWVQLAAGLIVAAVAIIYSYSFALLYLIKYSGFGDIGITGDHSPVTRSIVLGFRVITLTFPAVVWIILYRFSSLRWAGKALRIVSLAVFGLLPLWLYLCSFAYSALRAGMIRYQVVRSDCKVRNGLNVVYTNGLRREAECKNGMYDGFVTTYDADGAVSTKSMYSSGKLNGTEYTYFKDGNVKFITNYIDSTKSGPEVFYNEDGSTSLYILNEDDTSTPVYFQKPEKNISREVSKESQQFFCKNIAEYISKNYRYTCNGYIVNGEFVQKDASGMNILDAHLVDGKLNGGYDLYIQGTLYSHLEFADGVLNGNVAGYSTAGTLTYSGQYTKGLQEGVFRRYNDDGVLESEVVFTDGKITEIRKK